jgi:peptidoglycan-N-acetylmuramic acid deacetylase
MELNHREVSRRGLLMAGAASLGAPLVAAAALPTAAEALTPQLIYRGNTKRKEVAFSFDAGSDLGNAAKILDILKWCRITASFSLTGDFIWRYDTTSRRIANAGHHLINHSMHHKSMTGVSTGAAPLTRKQIYAELDGAETAFLQITGRRAAPWYRPPYGDINGATAQMVADHGWNKIAMWTVDSLGWKGTAWRTVRDRCLSRAQNGAIYVFHVGSASTDATALPSIITGLTKKGYRIVSVKSIVRP